MGERGPGKTPTKVLEMRGSWRAKGRENEPEPAAGEPECPEWIMPEAKEVWPRLCEHLRGMGLLAACDENALARYCQLHARWRKTEEWMMKYGDSIPVRDAQGEIVEVRQPPQVGRANQLVDRLLRLEKHFGLTPSARAGLAVQKKDTGENRGKRRFFKKSGA